jgi:hypothetical protein
MERDVFPEASQTPLKPPLESEQKNNILSILSSNQKQTHFKILSKISKDEKANLKLLWNYYLQMLQLVHF